MLRESFQMAWQNIIDNKMRSFLTTLGIMIGVTAIIALVSLMQGLSAEVRNQFAELGAGKLIVQAYGTPLKTGLSDQDLASLEEIDYVTGVSPTVSTVSSAVHNNHVEEEVSVEGKNELYFSSDPDLVDIGRPLNAMDMDGHSYVCVIDRELAESMFLGENPLGQSLRIGGYDYQVVGVLAENNDSMMASMEAMFGGGDTVGKAVIPYKNAMWLTQTANITMLEIYIGDSSMSSQVSDQVKQVLKAAFNYKDDSYAVLNMDSLLDAMETMQDLTTALLAGVASIALLVGGIGIMNMMLVSVTERTKEIGLRKALGAEPKRIQAQFIMEAIALSLLGGFMGLICGSLISYIASVAIEVDFTPSVMAITLGIGFSAGVGVIFGWAPARKASRLNPIDALRSE